MKEVKIEPIAKEDRWFYTCGPCWTEQGRETEPVVTVIHPYGVLDNLAFTPMCGNHAECYTNDERKQR